MCIFLFTGRWAFKWRAYKWQGGGVKQQFTVYQTREGLFQILFKSGLKRRAIALFLIISLLSKKSHFVVIFLSGA